METDKKENYLAYMDLLRELKNAEESGIGLLLEGESAEAETIAKACVFREEAEYRQEFLGGKNGNYSKVNFIRV